MIDENLETVQENGEVETPSVTQSDTEETPTEVTDDSQNPASQGATETPEERTVPYSALKEERERVRELKRQLAKSSTPQLEGADDEQIMQHPFVNGLLGKLADYELKEGAKDILEHYPQLPKDIAKAILRNPRGFLSFDTADVPTGLLDIEEYVQSIVQSVQPAPANTPQPVNVPVVNNNSTAAGKSAKDIEISKIQEKMPEDWTPEETAAVNAYRSQKGR